MHKKVKMEALKKVLLRRNPELPLLHRLIMTKSGNKIRCPLANQKPGTVHLTVRVLVSVRSFQPSLLILRRESTYLSGEVHKLLHNNKTPENPRVRKTSRLVSEVSFGTLMEVRPRLKSICITSKAHSVWVWILISRVLLITVISVNSYNRQSQYLLSPVKMLYRSLAL